MSLFSLFNKKQHLSDYSTLAVDMHSHLIPGIDDGVRTLEESLQLIRQFKELGYKKLITTPHVMMEGYPNTTNTILDGLKEVQKAVAQEGLEIEVQAAAEYFLDENFLKLIKANDLLLINEKYVLFELSFLNRPKHLEEVIFEIKAAGYLPLLAHPERYHYMHAVEMTNYRSLKESGVFLQVNLPSLFGSYGVAVKRVAELLVEQDLADFLGSDAHNIHHLESMHKGLYSETVAEAVNGISVNNRSLLEPEQ